MPFEPEMTKPRVKSPEKQKSPDKQKMPEKKKAGPMIPRAVRQKVVKSRHSSSSPSRSASRSPSPSKVKKISPKQHKKSAVNDRRELDNLERRAGEHRAHSPEVSGDPRRDKPGDRSQRTFREASPKNRDNGKSLPASDKRIKRSASPPQKKRPKKLAQTRRSISTSSTSSSDGSYGRSPVRNKRSVSPRRSRGSPSKRSPVKRRGQDDRSRGNSRYGKSQTSPVKPGKKGRKVELSPLKKRGVEHSAQSRDRNTPADRKRDARKGAEPGRKGEEPGRKGEEPGRKVEERRREISTNRERARTEVSPAKDTRRAQSPRDKKPRHDTPDTTRKLRQIASDSVEPDRGDRRKGEASFMVQSRDGREQVEHRDRTTKPSDEYDADYDARGRSPLATQVAADSPADRRGEFTQFREGYTAGAEAERFSDRERYDAYGREVYRRVDEHGREVERTREYPSGADHRERERYDREYDRSRYAAYPRGNVLTLSEPLICMCCLPSSLYQACQTLFANFIFFCQ